jgi:hypothetical protein
MDERKSDDMHHSRATSSAVLVHVPDLHWPRGKVDGMCYWGQAHQHSRGKRDAPKQWQRQCSELWGFSSGLVTIDEPLFQVLKRVSSETSHCIQ